MTLIVDTKLLSYNEMHAHKPVVNLFNTLARMVKRIESLSEVTITKIIFVYDIGKSSYRLDLWPMYKGKRSYGSVRDDFKASYEDGVQRIARELGISSFPIEGVEADDLAGILCTKLQDQIVLVTGDFDWLSLVLRHPEQVKYFNTKTWALLGEPEVIEFTGCTSEVQFLVKKCILGDSADNVIGVPGVGEVGFSKWKEQAFSLPDEQLQQAFLDLCHSKGNKTHRDYMYNGVHSCEELYDFNMKLGRVMSGVKHLTEEQKISLSSYYKIHCIPRATNLKKASELSIEYSSGYEDAFGDSWYLSESELEIFRRINGK